MSSTTLDRLVTSKTAWTVIYTVQRKGWETPNEVTTSPPRTAVPTVPSLIEPGTGYRLATEIEDRSFSDLLGRIQQHSGLDWGQIARTLGVTRRTIHNWLAGTRVSGANAQRLTALYNALTHELLHVERSDSRAYLLTPTEDGSSPLGRISLYLRANYARNEPVVTAAELLRIPVTPDSELITGGLDQQTEVVFLDDGERPVAH